MDYPNDEREWLAVCEREAARHRRDAIDPRQATSADVEHALQAIADRARREFPDGRRHSLAELLIGELSPTVGEVRAGVELYVDTIAAEASFQPSAGALLRCIMHRRRDDLGR